MNMTSNENNNQVANITFPQNGLWQGISTVDSSAEPSFVSCKLLQLMVN